jgi:anti-sigma factor RsiW
MITNDDPRLTAYALGELTDADRAAFEAELQAADPTAKAAIDAEIESIRAVTATLAGELKAEADTTWVSRPPLSSGRDRERSAHATKSRFSIGRVVVAAAAAVVVGGLAFSVLLPEVGQARRSTVAGQTQANERAREVALAINVDYAASGIGEG